MAEAAGKPRSPAQPRAKTAPGLTVGIMLAWCDPGWGDEERDRAVPRGRRCCEGSDRLGDGLDKLEIAPDVFKRLGECSESELAQAAGLIWEAAHRAERGWEALRQAVIAGRSLDGS